MRSSILLLSVVASLAGCDTVTVIVTEHGNNARTGVYLDGALTSETVRQDNFGVLYTRTVDGHILSQPLYVPLTINGSQRKLVLVATSFNVVYAFDVANTTRDTYYWRRQLGEPGALDADPAGPAETRWRIGILATPVVVSRGDDRYTVYVVTRERRLPAAPGVEHVRFMLYALDLATGNPLTLPGGTNPIEIAASAGGAQFDADKQNNRPALLYDDGVVYTAFAARRYDGPPGTQGWIIAHASDTLRQLGAFRTGGAGGVWQSGSGLATLNHRVLAMTANSGPHGNSFLVLHRDASLPSGSQLALESTFQDPRQSLNEGDVDLGSGGPVVLPDGRLIGGGKEGRLYFMNLTGGRLTREESHQLAWNTYHWPSDSPNCCSHPSESPDCFSVAGFLGARCCGSDGRTAIGAPCSIPPRDYQWGQTIAPNIHGAPVYWKPAYDRHGYIYVMGEKDYLKVYRYDVISHRLKIDEPPTRFNEPWNDPERRADCPTHGTPTPADGPFITEGDWRQQIVRPFAQSCEVRSPDGMPGGFLALSAPNVREGIVWAVIPACDTINATCATATDALGGNVKGYLAALDARTLQPYYVEQHPTPDEYFDFTKFMPVTIGDGKVFRATMDFSRVRTADWRTLEATDDPPHARLVVYGRFSDDPSGPRPTPSPARFICPTAIPPDWQCRR